MRRFSSADASAPDARAALATSGCPVRRTLRLLLLSWLTLCLTSYSLNRPARAVDRTDEALQPPATTEPTASPSNIASALRLRQGTVRPGQTAFELFRQAGVEAAQILALRRALRPVYDLSSLRAGRPFQMQMTPDGQLQRFAYEIDGLNRLEIERHGRKFVGRVVPIPHVRRERVVSGRITNSVYGALTAQGESPYLSTAFAEIFAPQVDFGTDLRRGDTFRLLIEEPERQGNVSGEPRILAAELVNNGHTLQAVYYAHRDLQGYYRPDGQAMQCMLLRSPVRYTRISSGFSHRRLHPILKRYRPHLGIDLAAPPGTPVHSVGHGTVLWAGRKGLNGNMLVIRHNRIYTTSYLHLSRFARGIRKGVRVKQGQVIGYVGSTGLSTGPHLDFRLKKYGKYVNPLSHRCAAAPPIPPRDRPAFQAHARRLLSRLMGTPDTPEVRTAMRQ